MRHFLKSKRFIAIAAIALVLAVTIVVCGVTGVFSAPQSNILSSLLKPAQSAVAAISDSIGGFFDNMQKSSELQKRVDELEDEIAEKKEKLKDY